MVQYFDANSDAFGNISEQSVQLLDGVRAGKLLRGIEAIQVVDVVIVQALMTVALLK